MAKAVQLNMPAEKGMSIQMEQAAQQSVPAKSSAASQTTPFQAANADQELTGQVVSVDGAQVQIRIEGTEHPEIGWYADLYYVTSQGKDLPVGCWQVESVAGSLITANKRSGVGNARTGLKAVLHQPQPAAVNNAVVIPAPVVTSSAAPVATSSSTQQPNQLLGQTPTKATQQVAPKNQFQHVAARRDLQCPDAPESASPRIDRTAPIERHGEGQKGGKDHRPQQ